MNKVGKKYIGGFMIKLIEFQEKYYNQYIEMYNEFIENKSDLIPDVLELHCKNQNDYKNILIELANRKSGNHTDIDWYKDGYYYLAFDDEELIGLGCIRNNLTQKGYNIWGNIAYGVRPAKRERGYATEIAKQLLIKAKELQMNEIILCHYEDNVISPKIFNKIGAIYINDTNSTVSNKKIKRYEITV